MSEKEKKKVGSKGFLIAVGIVCMLALALVGYVYHLQQIAAEDDGSYIAGKVEITREIEWLQEYVRIDTSRENETEGARFLQAILEQHGIESELIESAPGRGNLYARLTGRQQGGGLLLLNHIDVVPADEAEWSRPPFEAVVRDGVLFGRGVLDMKGIAITQLAAFIQASKAPEGLQRDLVFLATADEEQGGDLGVVWLIENRPDIFEGINWALNEGGVTETIRSRVTYFGVEVGSVPYVEAELRSDRREPLERARIALQAMTIRHDPETVHPELRRFLISSARNRVDGAALLSNLDATMTEGRFWRVLAPYRQMSQHHFVAQGIRSTDEGRFLLNIAARAPAGADAGVLIGLLDTVAGQENLELRVIDQRSAEVTSSDTPLFSLLTAEIQQEYGADVDVGPIIISGATTDSRYLRRIGITTYGVWPHPVDYFSSRGIHGTDEKLRLDWFVQGVALMERIVMRGVAG
jgi:acetylornithine deacetylase/succinyl-diaminopimelate desuccinylase-like protein